MRKTDSGVNTPLSVALSFCAVLQVGAERLLDHDPAPGVGAVLGQAVLLELADDVAEVARRDREVEGVVAAGAPLLVELLDGLPQLVERLVVVEVALDEAEPLGELVPHLLAELGAGVLARPSRARPGAKSWSAQSRRA